MSKNRINLPMDKNLSLPTLSFSGERVTFTKSEFLKLVRVVESLSNNVLRCGKRDFTLYRLADKIISLNGRAQDKEKLRKEKKSKDIVCEHSFKYYADQGWSFSFDYDYQETIMLFEHSEICDGKRMDLSTYRDSLDPDNKKIARKSLLLKFESWLKTSHYDSRFMRNEKKKGNEK